MIGIAHFVITASVASQITLRTDSSVGNSLRLLNQLPDQVVQRLDSISHINRTVDIFRIPAQRAQIDPVYMSDSDNLRITLVPL